MLDFFANFDKYQKKIATYIEDRVSTYYSSHCYKALKNRVEKLDDSIDMKFKSNRKGNSWESKFVVPLVREQYIIRRATLKANFNADPLFTLEPIGNTPWENAQNMQDVLNNNIKRTRFRDKCFPVLSNLAARYGTAISYARYHSEVKRAKKTTNTQFGIDRVEQSTPSYEVRNNAILPLNYFQNAVIPDPDESDFRGHVERVFLSDLIAEFLANRGVYIQDNLEKLIKEIKKNPSRDQNFKSGTPDEWKWLTVDVTHWWGQLNLEGNEDDSTKYYIQKAGDLIIRFQDNPNDDDIDPYSVYRVDGRCDYWWGNTDAENVIPAENVANLLMNTATDNVLRQMEHYLFVDSQSGLNPADVQNQRKNGGMIRFDSKNPNRSAKDYFYDYQAPEMSIGALDYANRENKEAAQRITSKADLTRNSQSGGPQNKTATAAVIMDERGNIIESDLSGEFAIGMKSCGYKNVVLLQQHLPNDFDITAGVKQSRRNMNKRDVLGNYDIDIKTSYTTNKTIRQTNLLNFMTALQNFKNVDPSWQNVDMTKVARKWAETYELGVDMDDLFPPVPMPGEVPTEQIQGQEQAGVVQPTGPAGPGPGGLPPSPPSGMPGPAMTPEMMMGAMA